MHHQPTGLCECGCGGRTNIATSTRASRGYFKGQPARYISGHNARGVHRKSLRYVPEDRGYETPCHIWQLYRLPNGYGLEGSRLAHRLAWQRANGPIPQGMWVCHRCDVPSCVNPDHLFLGTPSDNQYDCVAKGRRPMPSGEQASAAKLTWAQVRAIRASSATPKSLAAQYSVGLSTIRAVLGRLTWINDPMEEQ